MEELFNNRYRKELLIGRGAFSEVWKVTDVLTGVTQALKIYSPSAAMDDDGIEMMKHEFALMANVNHQNLLHPLSFDICDNRPFLVLPFCKNGNINRRVGKFTEKEAWELLRDTANALAYLHAKEPPIIHQDIKPANILISDDGSYMLTDFGVSTKAKSTLSRISIEDKSRLSAGTLSYMAPEKFSSNNLPIMANDIFSLGSTVYEMLTGYLPFGNEGGLLQKMGADIPELQGDYSVELKDVLKECLAKEPWDRPSAKDIAKFADNILEGKPNTFRTEDLIPHPQRKEQTEPEPVLQSQPTPEPEPVLQSQPTIEPEPVLQSQPTPEPEPEPVPQSQTAPELEPTPQSQPTPEPEPVPQSQTAPEPQPTPQPIPQQIPEQQPNSEAESDVIDNSYIPDNKGKKSVIIAVLVLLIGVGAATWWFFGKSNSSNDKLSIENTPSVPKVQETNPPPSDSAVSPQAISRSEQLGSEATGERLQVGASARMESSEDGQTKQTNKQDNIDVPANQMTTEEPSAVTTKRKRDTKNEYTDISESSKPTRAREGSLSYGSWTGSVSGGKPVGLGTLTISSAHIIQCNNGNKLNTEPGDKITNAEFNDNGILYQGTWIKKNGETKTILP